MGVATVAKTVAVVVAANTMATVYTISLTVFAAVQAGLSFPQPWRRFNRAHRTSFLEYPP